jgi:hypothetical protein
MIIASGRRQNRSLLCHPKDSQVNKIFSCKVTSAATYVFMGVGLAEKTANLPHVLPYACSICAAFTAGISVKFYVGGLHESVSRKSKFR